MFRKENGVTLVALVITIIVLLILAGVTISMVMGDESILTNADKAVELNEKADQEAAMRYAALIVRTDVATIGIEGAATPTYDEFTASELVNAVAANSDYTAEAAADGKSISITGDYYVTTGTINGTTLDVSSEAVKE